MKKFTSPELEFLKFEIMDVINTSDELDLEMPTLDPSNEGDWA